MKQWLLFLMMSIITSSICVESALAQTAGATEQTTTPIKHFIVVVGENHTFDSLFGGYQPRRGQVVSNLLSKGIINKDGSPGPHFDRAAQQIADNTGPAEYSLQPTPTGSSTTLPQPNTTYATGLPQDVPDRRFPSDLPNGPFQITQYVNFSAYVGDPPHRFFQMWQQFDEGALDLFPWVAITASIGPSNDGFSLTPGHPNQGGEAMGFYTMATGDAPYLKFLADFYAISDNFHQSIMGGKGQEPWATLGEISHSYHDG